MITRRRFEGASLDEAVEVVELLEDGLLLLLVDPPDDPHPVLLLTLLHPPESLQAILEISRARVSEFPDVGVHLPTTFGHSDDRRALKGEASLDETPCTI